MVIAATNDPELNRLVAEQAQAANMLANVVDDPAYSTVIFPSIVDRSPIQVAISSGGDAPVLVRLLRTQFEASVAGWHGATWLLWRAAFASGLKLSFLMGQTARPSGKRCFMGLSLSRPMPTILRTAEQLLADKLEHTY